MRVMRKGGVRRVSVRSQWKRDLPPPFSGSKATNHTLPLKLPTPLRGSMIGFNARADASAASASCKIDAASECV